MTLRRLFLALLACSAIAALAWGLLPRFHILIPWYIPLLAFAAIFAGTVLNTDFTQEIESGRQPETPDEADLDQPPPEETRPFRIDQYEDRTH